jgi:transforming growth factor-beta-induced protein
MTASIRSQTLRLPALGALMAAALFGLLLSPASRAGNIVETAVSAGSFNTLVAAVKAAGLVDALSGPGPLTVFAPTDEAFAALPPGTLDSLLKPENKEKLKGILLYHVVSGKVMANDIKGTIKPATLEGATLTIVASASGVTVNDAKVVKADVGASNGVIHVINKVLLPPAK